MIKMRALGLSLVLMGTTVAVGGSTMGCKNAQSAENAVFTAEQYGCIAATLAQQVLTGTAEQIANGLVAACGLLPTVTQSLIDIVNAFQSSMAKAQAAKKTAFMFGNQLVVIKPEMY